MKKFAIGASILLVSALVGCSNTSNTQVEPVPSTEQNTVQNTGDQKLLTEEEVTNIVNKEVPGGKVVAVDKDLSAAVPNYDFKVIKDNVEYELEVNAYDGSIRELEKKPVETKTNAIDETLLIGEAKAGEIAHAQVPEGEIMAVEYDSDETVSQYDVSIRDEKYAYDFEIDALTGEILKSEKELLTQ